MEKETIPGGSGSAMLQDKKKKMKVMVAIDESAERVNALKWVSSALRQKPATAAEMLIAFYATSSMVESVRKSQQENSAALLARAIQMCKDKMVKAESLILEGDPKDMICQSAGQMQIDLLVVGSRGLGKIKRAFLGSVSDYCTHHAVCPIIIVKPPKEQHE